MNKSITQTLDDLLKKQLDSSKQSTIIGDDPLPEIIPVELSDDVSMPTSLRLNSLIASLSVWYNGHGVQWEVAERSYTSTSHRSAAKRKLHRLLNWFILKKID